MTAPERWRWRLNVVGRRPVGTKASGAKSRSVPCSRLGRDGRAELAQEHAICGSVVAHQTVPGAAFAGSKGGVWYMKLVWDGQMRSPSSRTRAISGTEDARTYVLRRCFVPTYLTYVAAARQRGVLRTHTWHGWVGWSPQPMRSRLSGAGEVGEICPVQVRDAVARPGRGCNGDDASARTSSLIHAFQKV
ncbi:hypothetical protein VFPFJ_04149 [Purpureocillium lilacinum]|uniref:Uncharacterized protein n=1 Tax=Purpureocillium lilacinum TaxID=33203 RepID=A0A179HSK5_PURLI|nr:hypothetical protein VFPFJ_04149 [Purpureocillium lilacinum]OAQ82371.1 hypothetical protein VFPBJ_04955 [Purpureocillium lilacinum]OAQ92409.1 hypothetical protein VFPFJ_04149 [Purpureocillium lilacinum]